MPGISIHGSRRIRIPLGRGIDPQTACLVVRTEDVEEGELADVTWVFAVGFNA